MLFLRLPAIAAADFSDPLPLEESAALALERALLADDVIVRQQELSSAVSDDRALASWVMRLAELRTGQTVNRLDQAVAWFSTQLPIELAAALYSDLNY